MKLTATSLMLALLVPVGAFAEVITVRSGEGVMVGDGDPSVHVLSGPADSGFPATFGPADFEAARTAPMAIVIANNGAWISGLPSDPQAQWINDTGSNDGGSSGLYSVDFQTTSAALNARLYIRYAVDNNLGDTVNHGVFLNGVSLFDATYLGGYGQEYLLVADVISLLENGNNTLSLYAYEGGGPAGIIFSASLFTNEDAPVEVIHIRSGGTGEVGTDDPVFHVLSGPDDSGFSIPFEVADFAAAAVGPPAIVCATTPVWIQALPSDPAAYWINDTGQNETGRSALVAAEFMVDHAFEQADLTMVYAVDNSLGDGINPGVFVNEEPVVGVGSLGDFTQQYSLEVDVTNQIRVGNNTIYFYVYDFGYSAGLLVSATISLHRVQATAVAPVVTARPRLLESIQPNPFNPRTTIVCELPATGLCHLDVLDLAGRHVATLVHGVRAAGRHEFAWDGRDQNGRAAPTGTYICRLATSHAVETAKLVLVR